MQRNVLHECFNASRSDEDGNWINAYGLKTFNCRSADIQQTMSTLHAKKDKSTISISVQILHKQNWRQFGFFVKPTALEQQVSKFYPRIISAEATYHIYNRQLPVINVKW